MANILSARSLQNLKGVHPDLVKVINEALGISEVDFCIIEGLRTAARQKALVTAGASWTQNSRHITGHAVDVAAWVDGTARWDWPLYPPIAEAFQQAADDLNIQIICGINWTVKDGGHFELNRKFYP